MDMQKTGAYLASLRKGRNMTQQQTADALGVSNKTISKWESGAGLPDISVLPALAALYGVTADDILAGETRPRVGGEASPEIEAYLAQRGDLRFRIGYGASVLLLAAWAYFCRCTWSWLLLLAVLVSLWLGWSRCRGDRLRRRLLLLTPLSAVWLMGWIYRLDLWRLLVEAYAERSGIVRQMEWAILALRTETPWLLLPLLLAAVALVFGALLKEPLLRDKRLRLAAYGGCGLVLAAELARLAVCYGPALTFVQTAVDGMDRTQKLRTERYQALEAVAQPMNAVRWAALAAAVIVCIVLALRSRRKK